MPNGDTLNSLIGVNPDNEIQTNFARALRWLQFSVAAVYLAVARAFWSNMEIKIGKRFGRLLVVGTKSIELYSGKNRIFWPCYCNCGNSVIVLADALISKRSRSCGCLHRETAQKVNFKHGGYNHILYNTWVNMKRRCSDPKIPNYHRYGGRGIKVCHRWKSFKLFLLDLPKGWKPGLTLDRKNNDGNYTKSNVKWSTQRQQCNNFGRNKMVTMKGKTMSLKMWCRKLRKRYGLVQSRITTLGWGIEDAFFRPKSFKRV